MSTSENVFPYSLELFLLGAPVVQIEGGNHIHFNRKKAQALLYYLAIPEFHSRPVRREQLSTLLWSESPDKSAKNSLRTTLVDLRKVIGPQFIARSEDTIYLRQSSDVRVDVDEFVQTITLAKQNADNCSIDELQRVLQLYRGEFLDGFQVRGAPKFDEWLAIQREYFFELATNGLNMLTKQLTQVERYDEAIPAAKRLLALAPYFEAHHRQLISLYLLVGHSTSAVSQFNECRQMLQDEFGLKPSMETIELYESIRKHNLPTAKSSDAALAIQPEITSSTVPNTKEVQRPAQIIHLGAIPRRVDFYGREKEVNQLHQLLVHKAARIVAIGGIGGTGKTTLAAHFVWSLIDDSHLHSPDNDRLSDAESTRSKGRQAANRSVGSTHYDFISWHSLVNAPSLMSVVTTWLKHLSNHQLIQMPETLDDKLSLLFEHLREKRCLLVLDNVESILEIGEGACQFHRSHKAYEAFIRQMGQSPHRSTLLLTSREFPVILERLQRDYPDVSTWRLGGLGTAPSIKMLTANGLTASPDEMAALADRYSGNPLALKIIAETIHEFYQGAPQELLNDGSYIFDDIRDILNRQTKELSTLEKSVMAWLAIERVPISVTQVQENLLMQPRQQEILSALRQLQRRHLVEPELEEASGSSSKQGRTGGRFYLQNVVMEYTTNIIVKEIVNELRTGSFNTIHQVALLKARSKDYVRAGQNLIIVQPIAERLTRYYRPSELARHLQAQLELLREEPAQYPSYAAANIFHILHYLEIDLSGWDFSGLSIRQAYMGNIRLENVSFANCQMIQSVFTEPFGSIMALACSPDGQLAAAGTANGEIRVWRIADHFLCALFQGHQDAVQELTFNPASTALASVSADSSICLWDLVTTDGKLVDHVALRETLSIHTDRVVDIAFSPDGSILASASLDKTVCLHTMHGDNLPSIQDRPMGHPGLGEGQPKVYQLDDLVHGIAFSPNGRYLACATESNVRIWDITCHEIVTTLTAHSDKVYCVAFSQNGDLLATGSHDRKICLWDTHALFRAGAHLNDEQQPLKTLTQKLGGVFNIAFSPNGDTLASCGYEHGFYLWNIDLCLQTDASNGDDACQIVHGHSGNVWDLAFAAGGEVLISGSFDQTIRLWDITQEDTPANARASHTLSIRDKSSTALRLLQLRQTLHGYVNHQYTLDISPSGRYLASGGVDTIVRLWDLQSLDNGASDSQPTHALDDIHADSEALAEGASTESPCSSQPQIAQKLVGHTLPISDIAFASDERLLATCGEDHLRLWDISRVSDPLLWEIPSANIGRQHIAPLRLCWHPNGRILATSGPDATIRLWKCMYDGQAISVRVFAEFHGHTNGVEQVVFSPTGEMLVSVGQDSQLLLWLVPPLPIRSQPDILPAGSKVQIIDNYIGADKFGSWLKDAVFSHDGQRVATANFDHNIYIWEVDSASRYQTLSGHSSWIFSVAYSPDDSLLASGSYDHTIRLWDTKTGETVRILIGHKSGINSVSFSPDGQWIFSASQDETIRIWAVETGICQHVLRGKGPYSGMNISGIKGLSHAQITSLHRLGAVSSSI